jgi:hypothetical protein
MRDIRADLRERLETAEAAVKAAIAEVEMLKQMLQNEEARFAFSPRTTTEVSAAAVAAAAVAGGHAVIRLQGASPGPVFYRPKSGIFAGGGPAIPTNPGPGPMPPPTLPGIATGADLDDFLIRAIRRGVSDKDELRDGAIRAGYFTGSVNSPGRVVHARLTNLVRDGKLAKVDDRYVVEDNVKTAP